MGKIPQKRRMSHVKKGSCRAKHAQYSFKNVYLGNGSFPDAHFGASCHVSQLPHDSPQGIPQVHHATAVDASIWYSPLCHQVLFVNIVN
jgi:hypothetical protein